LTPEEPVGPTIEVIHSDHVFAGVQQVNNTTASSKTYKKINPMLKDTGDIFKTLYFLPNF
jgi:hypothetical protein